MMKKSIFLVFSLMLLLGSSTSSFSASEWTEHITYSEQAAGKLGFGLRNMFFSWTEILSEPYDSYQSNEGVAPGIFRGIGRAIGRFAGGAVHTVTFPMTFIDIPLPENGANLWPFDKS